MDFNEIEDEDYRIDITTRIDESKFIQVTDDNGYAFPLNSYYNPDEFASDWSQQYKNNLSNYNSHVLLFGIADGKFACSLMKLNPEMRIIIYEPSKDLAEIICSQDDIKQHILNGNITVLCGNEGMRITYHLLVTEMTFENGQYFWLICSPNYNLIYKKHYSKIAATVAEVWETIQFNRRTVLELKSIANENICHNIMDCLQQYSLDGVIEKFKNVDKKTYPAIVISAGPSLDKNIHDLQYAKNKAFLIAVDTSLNPLKKAGIVPDVVVTVDPKKDLCLFDALQDQNIPLVLNLESNWKIMENIHSKRIYCGLDDSVLNLFYEKYGKKRYELKCGGSVAHSAYSLAVLLGFENVIFVGQDLAYPNGKGHSEFAYGEKKNNEMDSGPNKLFEIESIDGGKVKTRNDMNMYRLWFERVIKVNSGVRHIDATEGGAKIHGMEIMTLRNAIDTLCQGRELDFAELMESVTPSFTDLEIKEVCKYIANYVDNIDKIKKKYERGIEAYETLNRFNNRHDYNSKGFRKAYSDVKKINEWINDDNLYSYLAMYTADDSYSVRENVYDTKDNIFDDLKDSIENGEIMINSYLKAIEESKKDMEFASKKATQILTEMGTN